MRGDESDPPPPPSVTVEISTGEILRSARETMGSCVLLNDADIAEAPSSLNTVAENETVFKPARYVTDARSARLGRVRK